MYVIYKVADSKNVKLEKDKITKMVRGLAGYSISLFRSWAEATESSKSRASLSLSATLILKKLEKLKENALKDRFIRKMKFFLLFQLLKHYP